MMAVKGRIYNRTEYDGSDRTHIQSHCIFASSANHMIYIAKAVRVRV